MTENNITRRSFLKTTLTALAAPALVPASALGLGMAAPSNRITMGCIGLGGMGTSNLHSFLRFDDLQVLIVCDVDRNHRDRAKSIVEGAYAGRTASSQYRGCETTGDFREIIARSDIDTLLIATPDHWHSTIAMAGARNGKDMYCEKPLSLTIADGRDTVNAVKRYGRVLQTGTWRRSRENCRRTCELVRNGRIGEVRRVEVGIPKGYAIRGGDYGGVQPTMPVPEGLDYNLWLGPAPWVPYTEGRCHFNFRWILDYSEGYISDWGAHYFDVAQWGLGMDDSGPVEVEGWGVFPESGLYDAAVECEITYRYANGVEMVCSTDYPYSVKFIGTEGWVHAETGPRGISAEPESILDSVILPEELHLYESNDHHRNFLDCVKSRRDPSAPAEVGHRSATICHLGNTAIALGRKVHWDPANEVFLNDDDANRMLARAMRSSW